ncbi:MAG: (Fe-S)-binding protein [Gammaproteobacteria bacterium]|nr:(Fe-S)-binding protein [Gammaproteobacteria bacterium]
MSDTSTPKPRVGLFVTCLVDLFRPNIGFAAVRLLEQAGCTVEVPQPQICCGQPAFNSGDLNLTRRLAQRTIEAFEGFDYVVAPSGSCASMIRHHYAELFQASVPWADRARALSERTHELLGFLHDVMRVDGLQARFDMVATYHDSCSGLREMGVQSQPRALLRQVEGLRLQEMRDSNVCCGFGGAFCVKFPRISERMVADKVRCIEDTRAEVLLGGDLGCLLNMAGRLSRSGSSVKVYHCAELLAGMADAAAIGEPES